MYNQLNPETAYIQELVKCRDSKTYFAKKYFNEYLPEGINGHQELTRYQSQVLLVWSAIFSHNKTYCIYSPTNETATLFREEVLKMYQQLSIPESHVIVRLHANELSFSNYNKIVSGHNEHFLRGRTIDLLVIDTLNGAYLEGLDIPSHIVVHGGSIVRTISREGYYAKGNTINR